MFAFWRSTLAIVVLAAALPALTSGTHEARSPHYHHDKVASGWYAGWHSHTGFPISEIPWRKYTMMTYAFAETTQDVTKLSLEGSNQDTLPVWVDAAHRHGVKALISVGGWTGSRYWSSMVDSAQNRTTFINTLITFVKKYDLDGLDFDWEYPGRQGIGCNVLNPNDTQNFLLFLQEFRQHQYGRKVILTVAASITPFAGPDGQPLIDVSAFAHALDYVAIMNYDIWGPWSKTVGPNAPLDDTCAPPDYQGGSAVSAVNAWTAAGIPSYQLIVAVPAYGHSFRVRKADAFINGSTELAPYPPFDGTDRPDGDFWDDAPPFDVCGAAQLPGGVWTFWGMMEGGFLDRHGRPRRGIYYYYDECSQTPYVYNPHNEIMISYDSAQSYAAKGHFIKKNRLAGFSMWETGGDYRSILLDAIRETGGYEYGSTRY